MPREYSYRLRLTRPDQPDHYVVIGTDGEKIASIYLDAGCQNRWRVQVGAFGLPVWDGKFKDMAGSLDEAKAKVKKLWPIFREHWTDEQYEEARRAYEANLERERNSPAYQRWLQTQAHLPGTKQRDRR